MYPILKPLVNELKSFGISAEVIKSEWGSTINIYDPDGNRIGIRDEISFKRQITA